MMAQPATLRGTALLEDRAQVRDFGTARDLGNGTLSRRLSNRRGHRAAGQRRSARSRHPRIFHTNAIEEAVPEDLVRLILGPASAFLRRAPLATFIRDRQPPRKRPGGRFATANSFKRHP
jgi:hypothetical protein